MKVYCAEGSRIIGSVTFGENCSVWYNAVIRQDFGTITIGNNVNIQDCCVLHCNENSPIQIGNGVTIGHGAVVHGALIGDNTLIGMGAVVMDHTAIGNNCIVAAGALVPPRHTYPDGMLIMGNPARAVRPLKPEEIEANKTTAVRYVKEAQNTLDSGDR